MWQTSVLFSGTINSETAYKKKFMDLSPIEGLVNICTACGNHKGEESHSPRKPNISEKARLTRLEL